MNNSGGKDMELCGEMVMHNVFGRGQIIESSENYVTVLFSESKLQKKFTYPAAFGTFLRLEDKSFIEKIKEDKKTVAENLAGSKRISEERSKLTMILKSKENRKKYGKKTTTKKASKKKDENIDLIQE